MVIDKEKDEKEIFSAYRRRRRARVEASKEQQEEKEMNHFESLLLMEQGEGEGGVSDNNNNNKAHVSAAKRLRMQREELLLLSSKGGGKNFYRKGADAAAEGQQQQMSERGGRLDSEGSDHDDVVVDNNMNQEDDGTKAVDAVAGTSLEQLEEAAIAQQKQQQEEERITAETSLIDQAESLRQNLTEQQLADRVKDQEASRIMKEASQIQTNALQAKAELAHGIVYTQALRTTWRPPTYVKKQQNDDEVRSKWHILVEGENIPPPMKRFIDFKFPEPILNVLKEKNINRPTPIQMQGLPVALSGRDMVGIAFTGSGKTMTFSLPLVMAALEEEVLMPLVGGEGPVGFILSPSRELARQTFHVVDGFCKALSSSYSSSSPSPYPEIRAQLLIGGENPRSQLEPINRYGVHCIVATPGRLRDFLSKKQITLDICRYTCLDEADRMLDLGFDEEVGEIMNHFKRQRQTLLFSATFPKKFQDFARSTLVKPIVVNVGRAGAANLDVIQEVEYVKQEAKIVYLLECLQKTAPPVIIFCERKGDVDDIHEYLLLKGVESVSIHGGKGQDERNEAIQLFKEGKKDVLIATDVAAKGLDFADIQHVINFDMPPEIENYVHRIGRTGRCGKTGVATTFINKSCEETTLLDLKHLLKEANQRIPPVLMIMDDPLEQAQAANAGGEKGCSFCGGLGHTIVDCPKIDKDARRVAGGRKDAIAGSGGYGGDW